MGFDSVSMVNAAIVFHLIWKSPYIAYFTYKILSFLRIWHVLYHMSLNFVLPTWSRFKQGVGAVVCYLLLQIASVLYYWGQWGRFWIVPTINTCQSWVCVTWLRRRKKVKVNIWTWFQDLSSYAGGYTANFVNPQGRVQRNFYNAMINVYTSSLVICTHDVGQMWGST